jgi:hypothetical protein
LNYFSNKTINVEFRDFHPNNLVDVSLFEQPVYQEILNNGLLLSPIKVIHSAAVHYQGRYRNNPTFRFLNAMIEILPSFSSLPEDANFYLNNSESNEFQTQSSEVLGVGLSISLTTKLFGISRNRIAIIEETGKRCDFTFEKNNKEYFIESKGRKNTRSINRAIKDVFEKKILYQNNSKYGVISFLPRNITPISIIMVDPESQEISINRDDLILRLLIYYTRQSLLAGFWRLADLLNQRVKLIQQGVFISEFENRALDYRNIAKLGNSYTISFGNIDIQTFFNADSRIGFRKIIENHQLFYALDRNIIDILENQNYESLLNYRYRDSVEQTLVVNETNYFSLNNDGSILGIVNRENLPLENRS